MSTATSRIAASLKVVFFMARIRYGHRDVFGLFHYPPESIQHHKEPRQEEQHGDHESNVLSESYFAVKTTFLVPGDSDSIWFRQYRVPNC